MTQKQPGHRNPYDPPGETPQVARPTRPSVSLVLSLLTAAALFGGGVAAALSGRPSLANTLMACAMLTFGYATAIKLRGFFQHLSR